MQGTLVVRVLGEVVSRKGDLHPETHTNAGERERERVDRVSCG